MQNLFSIMSHLQARRGWEESCRSYDMIELKYPQFTRAYN